MSEQRLTQNNVTVSLGHVDVIITLLCVRIIYQRRQTTEGQQ